LEATESTVTKGGTIKGSAITQPPQASQVYTPTVVVPYTRQQWGGTARGHRRERPMKRATTGSKGVKGVTYITLRRLTPQNSEEMVVVRGQEGIM
jgi:mRNA-degrading endonuclease toxin of MazEF toxin-antitoxin module